MGLCLSVEATETARIGSVKIYNSQTGQTTTRQTNGVPNWFPGASNVSRLIVPTGQSVDGVVKSMIQALPSGQTFSKIRLGSHGAPGMIFIGGKGFEAITLQNADALEPLREHFRLLCEGGDNYGIIWIHACKVADTLKFPEGPPIVGVDLLKAIARVTNTPVQAPYYDQPINATTFTGPTCYVYPSGSYAVM